MKNKVMIILVAVAAILCSGTFAEEYSHRDRHDRSESGSSTRPWLPLGLSIITPPLQLPSPNHSVFGAMVNLGYGQVEDVCVLDVGLVNNVTHNMVGIEVGPVNLAGTCFGAQVGAFNIADTVCGAQIGVVNMTGSLHGLQLGLLNLSAHGGAWVFPIFNLGF